MPLLQTDALVLHAANYLESSRLLRLLTREAGVQSVVARGARSSKKRFGSAVDLFAEGQAQIQTKPGRDLHGLNAFDVTKARTGLATDLDRFTAANALAEVVLRLVHDEAAPGIYEVVEQGLDRLATIPPDRVAHETVGILWRLLAEVGFRPVVDRCVECLDPIPETDAARFHVALGGTLCQRCARLAPGGRLLPPEARATIRGWLEPEAPADPLHADPPEPAATKAHQRLLREFLGAHLPDNRPLKAFEVWEKGTW
ncbi:MAG: DNA repair protein RecO [Gemmatimonadaceae bacterium]|nr:DNA repair protein RecO [Gemmatimonadaceae bacterium]